MKNSKIQIKSNKDNNIMDFSKKFKINKINNIFYLKKLNLQKFRNHLNLNLILSDSPILIYGENGCVKTNILEAISLLGPGKGLRKSKSEDYLLKNISSNEENRLWGVNADLQTPSGNINIGTGSLQKSLKKSRNMRINFENSSQSSVGEILKISWVTPQMCMLFQLSMSERRRFIDRLTSTLDSSHINRVFRYEKLIRERSNIIFQFKNETIWLNAIEKKISELSVCIAASRLNLILELDNLYEEESRNGSLIKDFPPAKIELKGDIENLLIRNSAIHVEDQIQQILKKGNIKNDISFNGPHTTQVNIINRNNGKQVEISSTGEQKLILISIILSHARILNITFNMPPILLLDDIIEHLDEKHRHALFLEVSKHFAQSWFTSTNKEPFETFPNIINKIFLPKVMNNNKGYYDYRNGDV
jgi:DNA replication and repair protein RecF